MYCKTMLTDFLRGNHLLIRVIHLRTHLAIFYCLGRLFIQHCPLLILPFGGKIQAQSNRDSMLKCKESLARDALMPLTPSLSTLLIKMRLHFKRGHVTFKVLRSWEAMALLDFGQLLSELCDTSPFRVMRYWKKKKMNKNMIRISIYQNKQFFKLQFPSTGVLNFWRSDNGICYKRYVSTTK